MTDIFSGDAVTRRGNVCRRRRLRRSHGKSQDQDLGTVVTFGLISRRVIPSQFLS